MGRKGAGHSRRSFCGRYYASMFYTEKTVALPIPMRVPQFYFGFSLSPLRDLWDMWENKKDNSWTKTSEVESPG